MTLFRFTPAALLCAGLLVLGTPSHAGFLDKIKKKVDKVSSKVDETANKVTAPVDEATGKVMAPVVQGQQAVTNAQNKAMAPVVQGQQSLNEMQQKAMAPVVNAKQAVDSAQNKAMAPVVNARQTVNGMQQQVMQPVVSAKQNLSAVKAPIRSLSVKQQLSGAQGLTNRLFSTDAALRRFNLNSMASPDMKTLRLTGQVSSSAERLRAQQLAARQFPGTIVNQIRVVPVAAKSNVRSMVTKPKTSLKSLKNPFR